MPPAPARLSTRLGCCQISPSFWVKARAVVSTGPPGGKGTMKRTGRVGQASAAWATRAAGSRLLAASAPPADSRRRRCDEKEDGQEDRRVGKECRSRWSPYH